MVVVFSTKPSVGGSQRRQLSVREPRRTDPWQWASAFGWSAAGVLVVLTVLATYGPTGWFVGVVATLLTVGTTCGLMFGPWPWGWVQRDVDVSQLAPADRRLLHSIATTVECLEAKAQWVPDGPASDLLAELVERAEGELGELLDRVAGGGPISAAPFAERISSLATAFGQVVDAQRSDADEPTRVLVDRGAHFSQALCPATTQSMDGQSVGHESMGHESMGHESMGQ
jgi:hypothetical protein